MKNRTWYVIGLMSGTSLDGVDLVYAKFIKNQGYYFEILKKETVNYSEKWKKKLQAAFRFSGEELTKLDVDYGSFLGKLVNDFVAKNKLKKMDFIASHGHTVFHQPDKNYTLQIGSGAVVAAVTNHKVICDFRVQDVAYGGQGAPLVPIGDKLLFADYDACLNLGGFANISFEDREKRLAFDICPVNIVLNHYTRQVGLEFDDKGGLAAQGERNEGLWHELNGLSFYEGDKPKSLGYEFVVNTVLPVIDAYTLPINTVLHTFIAHAAYQIARVINKRMPSENKRVLVTGGGVYNDFLMEKIAENTNAKIRVPNKEIVDFKEALIFAFLGVLKDAKEINCLQSVTGAERDHSSGVVFDV